MPNPNATIAMVSGLLSKDAKQRFNYYQTNLALFYPKIFGQVRAFEEKAPEKEFLDNLRDQATIPYMKSLFLQSMADPNLDITKLDVLSTLKAMNELGLSRDEKSYCMKSLTDRGLSLTAPIKNGYSPLTLAAELGDQDLVKIILDQLKVINPDRKFVDVVDEAGFNALHSAAKSGHKEVVEMLLDQYHADPTVMIGQGLLQQKVGEDYGKNFMQVSAWADQLLSSENERYYNNPVLQQLVADTDTTLQTYRKKLDLLVETAREAELDEKRGSDIKFLEPKNDMEAFLQETQRAAAISGDKLPFDVSAKAELKRSKDDAVERPRIEAKLRAEVAAAAQRREPTDAQKMLEALRAEMKAATRKNRGVYNTIKAKIGTLKEDLQTMSKGLRKGTRASSPTPSAAATTVSLGSTPDSRSTSPTSTLGSTDSLSPSVTSTKKNKKSTIPIPHGKLREALEGHMRKEPVKVPAKSKLREAQQNQR